MKRTRWMQPQDTIILSIEALKHDAPTAFAFVLNEDHP